MMCTACVVSPHLCIVICVLVQCGLFVKTNAVKPLKKEQPHDVTALLSPRSRQLTRASLDSVLAESHARIEEHREARTTVSLMLHGKQQSDTVGVD